MQTKPALLFLAGAAVCVLGLAYVCVTQERSSLSLSVSSPDLGGSGGLRPSPIYQETERRPQTVATTDPPSGSEFESRFRKILQIGNPLEREASLTAFLQEWAREAPEIALHSAPLIAPPTIRDHILRYLSQSWAAQSPEPAAIWALSLSDPSERSMAMDFVFSKIAESRPEHALKLLENRLDQAAPALVANLVQQWAGADLQSAFAWAAALPPGATRNEAIQRIAVVGAKSDPEKSAQWVLDEIPPGAAQVEAAVAVLHQWALKNLQSAKDWARQFPEGQLRDRVMGEIAGLEPNQ